MKALRWLLDGVLEGFGLVAAGIIGAGVAVGVSLPGPTPTWYILAIMAIAVFLASGIAVVRGAAAERMAAPPTPDVVARGEEAEAIDELAREVRELRAEIVRLRQPWWKRWRHAG